MLRLFSKNLMLTVAIVVFVQAAPAEASDWSDAQQVVRREGIVVTYRAKLDGEMLVVEVKHAEGWHTYSMDNISRARKKTGKEKPETELPTRIAISGGLSVAGDWLQSEPKELSQQEISWYTWGFEDVAVFAVPVRRTGEGNATVTIDAQACNATSCSMVDGLVLTLAVEPELADPSGTDFSTLVAVDTQD